MRFENLSVLNYLVIIIMALIVGYFRIKNNEKQASRWISAEMWSKVLVGFKPNQRKHRLFLLSLVMVFGVLGLARPQWGQKEETVRVTGLDIFFVLDVSNSMNVEDIAPSRLKKAQHVIRSIVERLKGDRVGVVLFAGSANLVSPLTTDHSYVLELLPTLGPEMVATQGTDIGSALELAASAIERGAVDPSKADQASKVVILVSDGEDLEQSALIGGDAIKKVGAKFIALGVGTEKGGPIPVRDERGALTGYKKDGSSPITSHFDSKALKKLASQVGGDYYDVTAGENEVDSIISQIGLMSRGEFQERKMTTFIERFQIPLALAVLFLVWELFIPIRGSRSDVALSILIFVFFSMTSTDAQAQSVEAYQKNNKGIQSFNEGKIDEAEKYFDEASKESPNNPKLDYNKGVVASQKGDSATAQALFDKAVMGAVENGDTETEAQARYNLGAVLEHKKDYVGAAEQWSKVKNIPELEKKAKERIANLLANKKQQEQKEKQDKENQDQDQKDKKEQDKDKKDKKDKDGQEKENQQKDDEGDSDKDKEEKKSYSQNKGTKFKSSKLSKEDAERVMAELLGKEKELQKKLGKKRGKVEPSGKDW